MRCADPDVRAVSLLASSGEATLSALGGLQPCAAATVWGDSLLLLIGPGPVAEAVETRRSYCQAELGLVQWVADPAGRRGQGALELSGRLRKVPVNARRSAALHLWETHPREELLDAAGGIGWQLAYLDLLEAAWQLPDGVFTLEVADVLVAEPDPVLCASLSLCEHLNARHRDVAGALAGRPAHFAELDRDGATLGVEGDRERYVRVGWPRACTGVVDVLATLRGLSCGRLAARRA